MAIWKVCCEGGFERLKGDGGAAWDKGEARDAL